MLAPSGELVGRDEELGELRRLLDAIALGAAAIIIEGEPGVGKTALWRAALAEGSRRGIRLLSTRPSESEAKLAFTGLGDLFGGIGPEVLRALPSPQRRAVEIALLRAEPGRARPDPRALAVSVLGVLRELASRSPLMVAVDDLQWIDRSSGRAMAYAIRRLGPEQIAILVTLRSAATADPLSLDRALPEGRCRRIPITGLSLGALQRMVTQRIGVTLSRRLLSKIHTESGGNPMFALEIAGEILRQGEQVGPEERLPVPETLRGLIEERLQRLDRPARQALVVVSALSNPSVPLVETVLGSKGSSALRSALAREAIVEEGGRLSPSHPLLGSVAYQGVPPEGRLALHRRLARLVTDPEERARHLALAVTGPDADVAATLEEASELARARAAPDAAAELAQRAADLTPARDHLARPRRASHAADHWFAAGETARARALLEDLAGREPPGPPRASLLWRLGRIRYTTDSLPAGVELFREAIDQSGDDHHLRGRVEQALSFATMGLGDGPAAARHAAAALGIAEELDDRGLEAQALALVAAWGFILGEGLDRRMFERAVELESAIEEGTPVEWVPSFLFALMLMFADHLDESRALFRRLHRQAAERGDEGSMPSLLFAMSQVECLAGDWPLADRYAAEALEACRESGQEQLTIQALHARAMVDAHLGRLEEARSAAKEGLGIAHRVGAVANMTQLISVLGFIDLSVDDPEATHDRLGPVAEMLRQIGVGEPGVVRFLPDEIEALIALGHREQAAALITQLEERGRSLNRGSALAAAGRCRGLLLGASGEVEGAIGAFDEAIAHHDRLTMPFERARTLLARGQVERRAKRWGAARASLMAALKVFEELGAARWADRARAELGRVGGRAPTPRELTATERAVAERVARGLSNREVADALFLSPKTVEGTLTKIYRKLGITSRTQLVARLTERPEATPHD